MDNISILFSIATLFLGLYLVTTLYQEYLKDSYREKLFALRNETFDYVVDKDKSLFASDAYRNIEESVNASIQFLDTLTLFSVLYVILKQYSKRYGRAMHKQARRFSQKEDQALQKLDAEDKKFFKGVKTRSNFLVSQYLIRSSWVPAIILLITNGVYEVLRKSIRLVTGKYKNQVRKKTLMTLLVPAVRTVGGKELTQKLNEGVKNIRALAACATVT